MFVVIAATPRPATTREKKATNDRRIIEGVFAARGASGTAGSGVTTAAPALEVFIAASLLPG
jgi:hypothetical protein